MELIKRFYPLVLIIVLGICSSAYHPNEPVLDSIIDSYNGVHVYYNGQKFSRVSGRSTTADGYNLGLKYQCVEFVKRYYFEIYKHKMPNSYGHAKDFFDASLEDIAYNSKRGLWQYRNVRESKPNPGDILVYGPNSNNRYGHVAIIATVNDENIEIIQQNMGKRTRQTIPLVKYEQYWTVADYNVLGWLSFKNDDKQ